MAALHPAGIRARLGCVGVVISHARSWLGRAVQIVSTPVLNGSSMVLIFLLSTVFASEPEGNVDAVCPATAETLAADLAATFAAYGVDGPQYLSARDRVFTQLDCVTEILPPAVAADVHAVMALDAFIARRPDEEVQAALRAYASVRPEAPLASRITLQAQLVSAATEAACLYPLGCSWKWFRTKSQFFLSLPVTDLKQASRGIPVLLEPEMAVVAGVVAAGVVAAAAVLLVAPMALRQWLRWRPCYKQLMLAAWSSQSSL